MHSRVFVMVLGECVKGSMGTLVSVHIYLVSNLRDHESNRILPCIRVGIGVYGQLQDIETSKDGT